MVSTAQKLDTLQGVLAIIEADNLVEGIEYNGEAVLDYDLHARTEICTYFGGNNTTLLEGARGDLAFMAIHAERMGLVHEVKHENLPIAKPYGDDFAEALAAAAAPFEVDGWKADLDERANPHRIGEKEGAKTYQTAFHRYVEPPTYPKGS